MNHGRLRDIFLPIGVLVLAVFAVYYTALGYGFVYDDGELILTNRWVLSFQNIPEAFSTHTFGFKDENYQAISYRPMLFVIYMAEYAIFGFTAWGWHLVNIMMHSVNSAFVFLILKHLLEAERPERPVALPAFAASLIFAVHPTNAETVSWLATMAELTFTFLCLFAFYLEARSIDGVKRSLAESAASKVLPALFFLAALLLKETAVVLPLIVFVYDNARRGLKGLFGFTRVLRFIPYAAAAFVYTVMRVWALKGEVTPTQTLHSFLSPYEFILNSIVLLARYFKAFVLPIGEPPLQLMDPVFSLAEPRAALSLLTVILVPVALALVLRKITRLWLLMLAIMILPILPTLYSPAISRFPFADRYLYFPSAGFAMLLAFLLAWSVSRERKAMWVLIFVAALSFPSAYLARAKSVVWASDRTLWGAALEAQPQNYVAVHAIAGEYLKEGRAQDALRLLESSLEANLSSAHPDQSMVILTRKVLPQAAAKAGRDDRAEAHLMEYLKLAPDDAPSLYNLGYLRQKKGYFVDAVDLYHKAAIFSRDPRLSSRVYFNLGECYIAMGMRDEAVNSFREGLRIAPGEAAMIRRLESMGVLAR